VTEDELPAYARALSIGFGESGAWFERGKEYASTSLDRTLVGFDGDTVVTTSRNYPFELTVPGGAILKAAGLSAVTVSPTHTRQGLLRAMLSELFDEAVAHGESLSMLTASEGNIYERFGYGITTRSLRVSLAVREAEFARPAPGGRFRLLESDDARKVEADVYDRMRRSYPGALSRQAEWWCEQYEPDIGTRFDVVYESPEGSVDGYVMYGVKEHWDHMGGDHRLTAQDFVAVTPEAEHALWRYLCDVDLVGTVFCPQLTMDSPLPWLLASARAMRVSSVHDYVWHRLLDVPATLGARTYSIADRVVLQIDDPVRRGGAADGTFAVDGGPDGADVATTKDAPDLSCGIAAASAAWLGGVRWSDLARAGLIEEHTDGALARADAMFVSSPLPYPFTWF
jgi:predicted acetyltransferase